MRRQARDPERYQVCSEACRYDPASLLEGWFHGADFRDDDADTIVIAWLITLPAGVVPAVAAEFMLTHLGGQTACPSSRQRGLLGLLEMTAGLRSERDEDRTPGND